MPQGVPSTVPADGLTTRQRRRRPLLLVHTGPNKGKSTAAFGLALRQWTAGSSIAVFQFVKSAKWRVGEETALRALGDVHRDTGQGGPVEWHKMGEGWAEIRRRLEAGAHDFYVLDEFTYPLKWGWIDVDEVVEVFTQRPGYQHIVVTGRDAPPALTDAADLVTEMTKIKHPMDAGQKGQRGIEW